MDKIKNNFNELVHIIPDVLTAQGSLLFSNIYSAYDSYILRNTENKHYRTEQIGCSVEIFKNGNFKFILPINIINIDDIDECNNFYDEKLKICDIASSMLNFNTVLNQYKRLLKKHDFNGKMYIRLNLKNCLYLTTYLDDDEFKKYISKNDIPISFKSETHIYYDKQNKIIDLNSFNPLLITFEIIRSLGISSKLYKSFLKSIGASFDETKKINNLNIEE